MERASKVKQSKLSATWGLIRDDYCSQVYANHIEKNTGLDENGVISDELWEEIVSSINLASGPGVDECYEYRTNKELLEGGSDDLRKQVQQRIYDRLAFYEEALTTNPKDADALELVERGLQDPIRVFGKNESTSSSKPTRVINSVSVKDSCVERATTLRRANKFSKQWMEGPSCVGIQLKDVDALREFRAKAEKYFGDEVEMDDMQGYEYSFREECHDVGHDIEMYMHCGRFHDELPMCEVDVTTKLLYVDAWLAKAPSIIVCSDGVVLETSECWLRSGRFKTSFIGTHVRSALCSIAASAESSQFEYVPAKSNGDDCLSKKWDLQLNYSNMGFTVTDRQVARGPEPWSFCSHLIFRDTHYPESICKTILNLFRNGKVTEELYDAFVFINRCRPDWPEIERVALDIIESVESALADYAGDTEDDPSDGAQAKGGQGVPNT